jgi:ABC-type enterochelin transport system permease subunit
VGKVSGEWQLTGWGIVCKNIFTFFFFRWNFRGRKSNFSNMVLGFVIIGLVFYYRRAIMHINGSPDPFPILRKGFAEKKGMVRLPASIERFSAYGLMW